MHIETVIVGQFEVNCYLVWNANRRAVVIDPGAEPERIDAILGRESLAVGAYLLTHAHVDHISALADLHRLRPAPVGLHADDLAWAFNGANRLPPWYDVPRRPSAIERVLDGGERMDDIGSPCRIVTTPGHTPGGICLYFEAEGVLFSGDTLFAGSVGRTDLPGAQPQALNASLKQLALLPDTTIVYPGHGPKTTIGHEKATNCFMREIRYD